MAQRFLALLRPYCFISLDSFQNLTCFFWPLFWPFFWPFFQPFFWPFFQYLISYECVLIDWHII